MHFKFLMKKALSLVRKKYAQEHQQTLQVLREKTIKKQEEQAERARLLREEIRLFQQKEQRQAVEHSQTVENRQKAQAKNVPKMQNIDSLLYLYHSSANFVSFSNLDSKIDSILLKTRLLSEEDFQLKLDKLKNLDSLRSETINKILRGEHFHHLNYEAINKVAKDNEDNQDVAKYYQSLNKP